MEIHVIKRAEVMDFMGETETPYASFWMLSLLLSGSRVLTATRP